MSCSHLWRVLNGQVTHFVEISRKIQMSRPAFPLPGYTGSCNAIHNGLPWLSTESHCPRTKPCLTPMSPSYYCGQGTPTPQLVADRTAMLLSHWADSDSPVRMTRYPFPVGCACGDSVLWLQSQLLQLLPSPRPCHLPSLTCFSLKSFLEYEKISKFYA